ncbi:MAG TPA: hypothetical protein VEU30_10095 [Thermoanaerobaculia bacterium]|nr:hypothetical protein [Thermoanaerobaculia bacterium]
MSRASADLPRGTNVTTFDGAFNASSQSKTKLFAPGGVYYSMTPETRKYDETRIAEEIVSVLGEGVARACSAERGSIRYAVRAEGMKLRTIVLKRDSLRKLAEDPAREIKLDYLKRDLLQSSETRREFKYPRVTFRSAAAKAAELLRAGADAHRRFATS